ncbi:MAG: glutamine-hydrolyzing carbamoyl-phosphate synthase small subunit [Actinomycetota bacterium]|nr:glutamine-hydrolyzing carbamoyl-phosphate synthase small subunit [Actinomycetota bacterium]
MRRPALLVLEDGEVFKGESFGSSRDASGEVVFNTSMSGYQEVLTDPSYEGQIVAMTYPHIGNYGVNPSDPESSAVRVNGFVIRDLPPVWSNWRASGGLDEYLKENGIPGITEVDTRRLTRHIREKGAMRGVVSSQCLDPRALVERARSTPTISEGDRVGRVSVDEPYVWPAEGEPRFKISAYDYGIKHNILRNLASRGCEVTVFPAKTPVSELLSEGTDGVFISNGPGDPQSVKQGIRAIQEILGKVPVFGICLGHQLLALAIGLKTYKLRFGHRGINHPVARLRDGRTEITTQNHGFSVVEEPFGFSPGEGKHPRGPGVIAKTARGRAELTHLNLNDHTIEGFKLLDEPAFCVQYHPEAGPGPHDSNYLFEEFLAMMNGGEEVGSG